MGSLGLSVSDLSDAQRRELKLKSVEWGPKLVGCNRQEVVTESNRFLCVSQA